MARVLVDTNVLFPFSVMDLMLALTEDHIHDLVLTEALISEWQRVIVRERRRSEAAAASIADAIREFFAESFVPEAIYRDLTDEMPGSDEDDRAHMAAAVAAGASVIVTWNRSDFPSQSLARHGIRVLSPDEYLCELITELPRELTATVGRIAAGKQRPPMTVPQLVARLAAAGVPNFAVRLKDRLDLGAPSVAVEAPRPTARRRGRGRTTTAAQEVAAYLATHRPPDHRSVTIDVPPTQRSAMLRTWW